MVTSPLIHLVSLFSPVGWIWLVGGVNTHWHVPSVIRRISAGWWMDTRSIQRIRIRFFLFFLWESNSVWPVLVYIMIPHCTVLFISCLVMLATCLYASLRIGIGLGDWIGFG